MYLMRVFYFGEERTLHYKAYKKKKYFFYLQYNIYVHKQSSTYLVENTEGKSLNLTLCLSI